MKQAISEKWVLAATLLTLVTMLFFSSDYRLFWGIVVVGGIVGLTVKSSKLAHMKANPSLYGADMPKSLLFRGPKTWVLGVLFAFLFLQLLVIGLGALAQLGANPSQTAASAPTSSSSTTMDVATAPESAITYEDSKNNVWTLDQKTSANGVKTLVSPSKLIVLTFTPDCRVIIITNIGSPQTDMGKWGSNSQGWNVMNANGEVLDSFPEEQPPFDANCPID